MIKKTHSLNKFDTLIRLKKAYIVLNLCIIMDILLTF